MVCVRFSALPCIGCVEVLLSSFLRGSGRVCKKAGPLQRLLSMVLVQVPVYTFTYISHFTLTTTFEVDNFPHFTDEETEALRDKLTCSSSHS